MFGDQIVPVVGSAAGRRYAVIDMGSSSIKLSIIETTGQSFREVYKDKARLSIGRGIDADGVIGDKQIDELMLALSHFKSLCELRGAQIVGALATSAFRRAKNFLAVQKLAHQMDLNIEVIDGATEGRLGFLSIVTEDSNIASIDMGSWSLQLAGRDSTGAVQSHSYELGYQLLFKKFFIGSKKFSEARSGLESHLAALLGPSGEKIPDWFSSRQHLYAVGGNRVFALLTGLKKSLLDTYSIKAEDLSRLVSAYESISSEAYQSRLLEQDCEKLLPTLVVYNFLLSRCGFKQMTNSKNKMATGKIIEFLKKS